MQELPTFHPRAKDWKAPVALPSAIAPSIAHPFCGLTDTVPNGPISFKDSVLKAAYGTKSMTVDTQGILLICCGHGRPFGSCIEL